MEDLQNNLMPSEDVRPERPETKSLSSSAMSLRSLLSSGKMIAMIICLAVSVLLVPLGRSIQAKEGMQLAEDIIEESEFNSYYDMDQFYDILEKTQSESAGSYVFGSIPMIIAGVGFLILFLSSRNASTDRISTTGFTLLKVMNIIGIVGYSLIAVLVVFLSVLMIVIGFATGEAALGIVFLLVTGIFFLIFGAVLVLLIIKNAGLDSSIESLKAAINDDPPVKKVSGFSVVMLYIIGGLSAFTFISSLTVGNIPGALGSAATVGYYFLLGINLNIAKDIVNR